MKPPPHGKLTEAASGALLFVLTAPCVSVATWLDRHDATAAGVSGALCLACAAAVWEIGKGKEPPR